MVLFAFHKLFDKRILCYKILSTSSFMVLNKFKVELIKHDFQLQKSMRTRFE